MSLEKYNLRKQILGSLKGLSESEMERMSEAIAARLFALEEWKRADCIFAYISMPYEVATGKIIRRALDDGKAVGAPRIYGDCIVFHVIHDDARPYTLHRWGMEEPEESAPLLDCRSKRSLVLVPGLAFGRNGVRLGRGRGYYDRFLAEHRQGTFSVGLSFDLQLGESVPADGHDMRLSAVVTEIETVLIPAQ